MGRRMVQVDAFTRTPFAGNPAAVCLLEHAAEDRWMQSVAAEMNLSETAFLHPAEGGYRLRWFTPTVEVDLCGHATLASAHVLWEEGHLPPEREAHFHTRSGLLTAAREGDWIALDFPATPARPEAPPAGLIDALHLTPPRFVGRSKFDYLIEVDTETEVRSLAPDFGALARVEARGVIVTARASTPGYDFISRFFGPRAGVNEDPVTGSAHCALAPYWSERLGKDRMMAYQASRRGGEVRVAARGERVGLSGQAVTVLSGELA
ncbi:MAG TPA: PhzF family phenazine biosynthesis protein [Gemmatimonadales bacterium]|nr:PhzF family phenazine biosynthesis protein [Gemmatimonadales bacterium]